MCADVNAHSGQVANHLASPEPLSSSAPGRNPAGTVTGGSKAHLLGFPGASEKIAGRAHVPWYQDGLTDIPVLHGNGGISRTQRSGGSLPVHYDRSLFPVHTVSLLFCDIVRNVVEDIHSYIAEVRAQDLVEGFPDPVCYHLPVCPGVVCRAFHCLEIALAAGR